MNTAGTDENLFRLVPVRGHGARVLPLEPVPVPGHDAQICARAPTKGCVQTGAQAPCTGTSLNGVLGPGPESLEPNRTGSSSVYMDPLGTDPAVYTGQYGNRIKRIQTWNRRKS